jgi:hypothetical protein
LGEARWQGLEWRAPSLAKLTALTSLHIGGECWEIYDEQMEAISKLPALTHVHLEYWFSEEVDMRLWALASRLPGLTHLHLSGGDFLVSNDGLRAIASLTALSHLHLYGCDEVSNDELRAIASLASLTHLHLVYCPQVTNQGLRAIASLTALRLQQFHCVTDEGVELDAEQPDGAEVARRDGVPQGITRQLRRCGNCSHWTTCSSRHPVNRIKPASPSTCRSYCEVRLAAEGVAAV